MHADMHVLSLSDTPTHERIHMRVSTRTDTETASAKPVVILMSQSIVQKNQGDQKKLSMCMRECACGAWVSVVL